MESPDKALKALRVGRVRRIVSLGEDDGAVKTLRIPSPFMREALTRARREARRGGGAFCFPFIAFIFKFLSEMSEMIDVSLLAFSRH